MSTSPYLGKAQRGFPFTVGEAADRVRCHDWHAGPLGHPDGWPLALRHATSLMLASPESMYLVWGDELVFLFNDAYSPILGPRLEQAMGAPLRTLWADAWDAVKGPVEQALAGGSSRYVDMPVRMNRYGVEEETWWTFSFSPIHREDGSIGGVFCVTREVTQAIVAQRRLAHENERLIALFEKSPMFMAFLSGPEHRVELANPRYAEMVGNRPVIGQRLADAIPEVIDQGYLPLLDQVYRSGETYIGTEVTYDPVAADGGTAEPRKLDIVFQPVKDEAGQSIGVFVQGLDVTSQVALQRRLRRSEARHRQIMDSAMDYAIFAMDLEGRITLWNEGARHTLGWTEAEMLGQTPERFYLEKDRRAGRFQHGMKVALAEGGLSGERPLLRKTGETFWAQGALTLLRDEEGTAIGFVIVLRDRTLERAAVDALAASERRLGALVAASSQVLYALSADWRERRQILRQGDTAQLLPPDWNWREAFVHPDDRAMVDAAIAEADRQKKPFEIQHRTPLRNGSHRWVLMRVVPMLDADGAVSEWFGTATDITGKREAEERLQQLTVTLEERVRERSAELLMTEEKLRQSQKMEAVGQLTGGIAHDFNNLLTSVSMGLELLEMRVAQGRIDDLGRYVEMARSGADRAAALTQRLLAFSRRQTLAPTGVVVEQMVLGMMEIITRSLGPSIAISTAFDDGGAAVQVDGPQLENALLNLCINARDAMPDGGTLAISSHAVELAGTDAAALELPAGPYVRLSVRDSGTGMEADVVAKVFEPFFTTKPIGQGTGLGLSMIYGFTRQSGGQVQVDSRPMQGTTMHLYLPRMAEGTQAPADPAAAVAEKEVRRGPMRTVLLVEDETAVRVLVSEVLVSAGYRVIEASEGPPALDVLRSVEPIDLLLTDVGLTGPLNGRQVADAGRQCRPGLPVMFITGYAASAAVGAGHMEAGMEVLAKPFSAAELVRRADALLSRSEDAPRSPRPTAG
ncbi:PAS domain-containing protein [Stenotrophomonas sp. NPDC078853]|uniref:hybrid sensor histidine kinase/response regulator n=1 Tax=Stenotrophomonas sp. NPDC078853 TaxID=3364534 RepID=UPI00384DFBE9